MRFSNLAQPGFDGRIVQVCFFDNRPATESLISTGVAIDFHTQINFVLETLFGSSGQSQLQRFKITFAGTPFSLDTDSTTSSTSLLIVRLAFRKPLDPRDPRLSQNWE